MDTNLDRGDGPTVIVSFRLPLWLRERLQRHADQADKPMGAVGREWLAERAGQLDNGHAGPPEIGAGTRTGTTDPAIPKALHDLHAALQMSAAETMTALRNLDIRLREKTWEDLSILVMVNWLIQNAYRQWEGVPSKEAITWIAEERSRRHAEQEERIEKAIQAGGA